MTAEAARRPPARGTFDASHIVVAVLAVGLLLGLVSFALPSGASSHGSAASLTEGKVFEGRKFKYRLRAPPGSFWRATPEFLLPPTPSSAVEPDLSLDRPGTDARVLVIASPLTQRLTLDEIVASVTAGQAEGASFEESERAPMQYGPDQGLFVRGRSIGGRRAVATFVLVVTRDNMVYVVLGAAPEPVAGALATQISSLVKSFEPPPSTGAAPPVLTGNGVPALPVTGTPALPVTAAPTALPLKK